MIFDLTFSKCSMNNVNDNATFSLVLTISLLMLIFSCLSLPVCTQPPPPPFPPSLHALSAPLCSSLLLCAGSPCSGSGPELAKGERASPGWEQSHAARPGPPLWIGLHARDRGPLILWCHLFLSLSPSRFPSRSLCPPDVSTAPSSCQAGLAPSPSSCMPHWVSPSYTTACMAFRGRPCWPLPLKLFS